MLELAQSCPNWMQIMLKLSGPVLRTLNRLYCILTQENTFSAGLVSHLHVALDMLLPAQSGFSQDTAGGGDFQDLDFQDLRAGRERTQPPRSLQVLVRAASHMQGV